MPDQHIFEYNGFAMSVLFCGNRLFYIEVCPDKHNRKWRDDMKSIADMCEGKKPFEVIKYGPMIYSANYGADFHISTRMTDGKPCIIFHLCHWVEFMIPLEDCDIKSLGDSLRKCLE